MEISHSKSALNFENALFLLAHHKFVLALISMKIRDFSYFLRIKTMSIPPTFSFDTTTTVVDRLLQTPGWPVFGELSVFFYLLRYKKY